jgi:selenocysteine-specific elongation factor
MVLDDAREAQVSALEGTVLSAGATFLSVSALESSWPGREPLADAIALLRDRGRVIELGGDGVIHRDAVERCVDAMRSHFAGAEELSVGDLKGSLGLSRKHAIPLLEYFDAQRITQRRGNARVKGPSFPG